MELSEKKANCAASFPWSGVKNGDERRSHEEPSIKFLKGLEGQGPASRPNFIAGRDSALGDFD